MSQLSDVFEQVKQDILSDNEIYICISLDDQLEEGSPKNIVEKAKRIIKDRLGDSYSYEAWVSTHHPNLYHKHRRCSKSWDAMRKQGRINWLDSLIEEFK